MPNPARIIPVNVFDQATLTTTIAPYSTTPVTNLQNPRRARTVRWPAASGTQSIKGTWNGQGFQVGGASFDRFNLEPAATVRFRGFQNQDWTGSTLIDTGTIAPYNAAALGSFTWGKDALGTSIYDGYQGYKFWVAWFTQQTIQSFQFDISDVTNSSQYIDISRAIVGDYIETSHNASLGLVTGWRENTEQQENDGGSIMSNARVPRRGATGTFKQMTATDRANLSDFLRYVGKRKTFLITFQSSEGASLERDYTIPQAKFSQLADLAWSNLSVYDVPFTIVEA